jgi:hypothetical protein
MYIYIFFFCHISVTTCHICGTRRANLQLPKDGQDIWPKHVDVVYNKHKNTERVSDCFTEDVLHPTSILFEPTSRSRDSSYLRISLHFMEPDDTLQCSQQPAICLYPE